MGCASPDPKLHASGTKRTIDIPAVVQQWEVMLDGPEGTASPNPDLLAAGDQVQVTLFVPSGAIRFAADSIVQVTHKHTPNTEIAYLTGMAKNNKNSKQSIYGKSINYLCFVLELRSKMAAGTKECLYLLVLNFGSL